MKDLIAAFTDAGWTRNVNLRAATYDFRVAGIKKELDQQYDRLKNLIEETYDMNDKMPVHLLSHSLGGPYVNLFLNDFVNKSWKEKYI